MLSMDCKAAAAKGKDGILMPSCAARSMIRCELLEYALVVAEEARNRRRKL